MDATHIYCASCRAIRPVEFERLLAANEGHGFARKENLDYYFFATILFLQETLLKP